MEPPSYSTEAIDAAASRWQDWLTVNLQAEPDEAAEAGRTFARFCGLSQASLDHTADYLVKRVGPFRASTAMFGVLLGLLIAQEAEEE